MLRWAATFLVIAILAAFFGFGGVSNVSTDIAKVLFFLFIVGFVVTGLLGLAAGKRLTR